MAERRNRMITLIDGTQVELKTGFTVHNTDGTSQLMVYTTAISGGPGGHGPGEPLPIEDVA